MDFKLFSDIRKNIEGQISFFNNMIEKTDNQALLTNVVEDEIRLFEKSDELRISRDKLESLKTRFLKWGSTLTSNKTVNNQN